MIPSFSLGKCKTRAGYSAKLKNPQRLDLKSIKFKFETILETPILLVIKTEQGEVIVHGYGELLFKEGKDMDEMEKIAERIYEVGLGKK